MWHLLLDNYSMTASNSFSQYSISILVLKAQTHRTTSASTACSLHVSLHTVLNGHF